MAHIQVTEYECNGEVCEENINYLMNFGKTLKLCTKNWYKVCFSSETLLSGCESVAQGQWELNEIPLVNTTFDGVSKLVRLTKKCLNVKYGNYHPLLLNEFPALKRVNAQLFSLQIVLYGGRGRGEISCSEFNIKEVVFDPGG